MDKLIGGVFILAFIYVLVMAVIEFITKYIAPVVGAVIIIAVVIGIVYGIIVYIKDPTKRLAKNVANKAEEKRQKFLTERELKRKLSSEMEEARTRAILLSSQLYEKTILALGDEKIKDELDELKIKAEEKILTSKIEDIDLAIARYKDTIKLIENSTHLNSTEKAQLYKEATKYLKN